MAKTCHPENTAPIGRRKFMETASLVVAAIVSARAAKAETGAQPVLSAEAPATPLVNPGKPMTSDLTAAQVRDALQLEPNQTCGFVRSTYKSALDIAPGGLPAPFAQGRPLGTALFFMLTPEAPVKLHRIMNDQLYHYYLGDPIELRLMYENGATERMVVGPDILSGQRVQFFIPGGTFHTARIAGERRWFLGGSTEWPGVDPARDVELGDPEKLAAEYPEAAEDIRAFPKPS